VNARALPISRRLFKRHTESDRYLERQQQFLRAAALGPQSQIDGVLTMKKLMMGVAATALLSIPVLAIPVLAFEAGHDRMGMMGGKGPATRAEVQSLVKLHFGAADTNKDGFLDKGEIDAHHAKMQADMQTRMKQRMDEHFADLDANKDGSISRQEFDAKHQGGMGKEEDRGDKGRGDKRHGDDDGHGGGDMHMAMAMGIGGAGGMMSLETLDTDKDGKLSLAEVAARPLAMFDGVDTNKDGTISPDERRAARAAMWEKMRSRKDAPPAPNEPPHPDNHQH
jgi:hypothetical protein